MTELPMAMIENAVPASAWVIVLPIVLALVGAAGLLMFRRTRGMPLVGAVLVVLGIIACEIALLMQVIEGGPVSMTMGRWLPPFGISLTADVFGTVFALASAVVTLLVLLYAEFDRADAHGKDGFHSMVLLLLAGVTGAFLTGDLFNLYVWFEVMLIASFGLIVHGGRAAQLEAALKYGFLNFLATTIFLLALGLLYGLLGTLNMADILRVAPNANPAAMTGIATLLLLAFGMKAAAFPLNAWLPASYHLPSPAVSALFAGLLTKVGAYALLRALVVILPASRDALEPVLATVAIATLLVAPLGAIAETNLRRAIGFLVIGGIGAVLAGMVVPTETGIAGSGLYIFHAILTMTALYLAAGLIEKRTATTDTRNMGGLYAASTPLSVLFFVLILATAGVPPFLGFWPKLLLLQAGFADGWIGQGLVLALLVNAVLTLIAGTRLWSHVFWRPGPERADVPLVFDSHGRLAFGATSVLAVGIVVIGLWPAPLMAAISVGAGDMADPARYVAATGLAEATP
jgi:multicomponent Na+:H+ antiporter subunit D